MFSGFVSTSCFIKNAIRKRWDKKEIEAYLNHVPARRNVSASTQSAALNAIAFLYLHVLKEDMPNLDKLRKVKRYKHISQT